MDREQGDLPIDKMEEYIEALLQLMEVTVIFPNPVQLIAQGKKVSACMFMRLAALSLGYKQPMISVVKKPTYEDVKAIISGERDTVLKRENSDSCHHVIRKGKKVNRRDFEQVLADGLVWEASPFGIPKWLEQPYIPDLMHLGEVRTFIVNGLITYMVLSVFGKDGNWQVETISKVRPKDLIG